MTQFDKHRAIERRRMLQLRQKRVEVSEPFRSVARKLCPAGARFSKLMPARCRATLGTLAAGPARDERLVWTGISGAHCSRWASLAERNQIFAKALANYAGPAEMIAVIWHPGHAGLHIRADELAKVVDQVLEPLQTIWIVSADGGDWLIEVASTDNELCHARKIGDGTRPAIVR